MNTNPPASTASAAPEVLAKPLLIYDGDCGFCRRCVVRGQRLTGDAVDYAPYQQVAGRFPQVSQQDFRRAVQLVEPGGRVTRAARAVFGTLAHAGRGKALWAYEHVPGFAAASELGYRVVAANRGLVSRLLTLLWGSQPGPASYILVRWLFMRGLGLVYFIAFLSWWVQFEGLTGSQGIVSAQMVLDLRARQSDGHMYWNHPTLLWWFGTSDAALHLMCAAGVVLAVMVMARVLEGPALLGLWALYLSLCTADGVFLGFQWENLLLETGFLALFWASWRPWPRLSTDRSPGRAGLWLLRWLLFRLMLSSGMVKLLGGDEVWHDCTALHYHYYTQCIPTPLAWYAQQLPAWFQKLSCQVMFAIELAVPFFFFAPRRLRLAAAALTALFMGAIAATGNYNYFNLLTVVLCVTLLDDAALQGVWPRRVLDKMTPWLRPRRRRAWLRWPPRLLVAAAALALFAASTWRTWMSWDRFEPTSTRPPYGSQQLRRASLSWPGWLKWTAPVLLDTACWQWPEEKCRQVCGWTGSTRLAALAPAWLPRSWKDVDQFRTVNSYGLFTNMTDTRPEIIIEGSRDGQEWSAYEFKYKPGDLQRRPPWVAPHQPRLDWQMWFEALHAERALSLAGRGQRRPQPNFWFGRFLQCLLEGQAAVLALLEHNPFPDGPPRFIRAELYQYEFTTFAERRQAGAWWKRRYVGRYAMVQQPGGSADGAGRER